MLSVGLWVMDGKGPKPKASAYHGVGEREGGTDVQRHLEEERKCHLLHRSDNSYESVI